MSSSLSEIRDALKATLAQAGLYVYESVPDVTNSPAAVVLPDSGDFQVAMSMGGDTYHFDIPVVVAALNVRDAQRKLDQFITGKGPKSLREHLFHNPSLGLSDVDCSVKGFRGYGGSFKAATTEFVGAVLKVCVTVT